MNFHIKLNNAVNEFNTEFGGLTVDRQGDVCYIKTESGLVVGDGDITTQAGQRNLMATIKDELVFHRRRVRT
jgi:N-dimethylarginine dimethylaminohydrolase